MKNIHVSAIEQNGKVVFLHKIKEGPTDKSYGIHVAKLAELPTELINRANEILSSLENQNGDVVDKKTEIYREINEVKGKEEHKDINESFNETVSIPSMVEEAQLSFFEEEETQSKRIHHTTKEKRVLEKIKELDILDMTPMQAMNILYELHKKIKS